MLYYLFDWLQTKNFPGAGLFHYISFRAVCALALSFLIMLLAGKPVIKILKKHTLGEEERDLGLIDDEEKKRKKNTPKMGGLLIIASLLLSVLLFNKLDNIYVLLMIFTTIWLGLLGFWDDYIKCVKHNKEGISEKTKLIGQVVLGFVVGVVMYFHPAVGIKENYTLPKQVTTSDEVFTISKGDANIVPAKQPSTPAVHSTKTTIPFVKNHEFNYAWFTRWMGDKDGRWSFLFYIPIIVFILTAVSNGANLTDGMDGLVTGVSVPVVLGIAALAYVSGNAVFADYLNIMYIPNISELVVFISALVGALIGFYWWNCYPAKVFMGDVGSLTLGGIIAVSCIIIRKELLIPLLCGVFLIEVCSALIQRVYFKYTKKKYGKGRRVFLMTPIHHNFQKKPDPGESYIFTRNGKPEMHESDITQRFIIVSIICVMLAIITLKIR